MRLSKTTRSRMAGGTGGDARHAPSTKQTRDDDNVSASEATTLRTCEDVPLRWCRCMLRHWKDDPRASHLKISLKQSRLTLYGC